MGDQKDTLPENKNSKDNNSPNIPDDEDLLYTHKPDSRGGEMRWNTTLCRKPGR
ncbi:MAG TPA: hypothetical protein HA306_04210 [Methanosarcina sp.]|nr:hypothetical protein [Methanosarcina sp.]